MTENKNLWTDFAELVDNQLTLQVKIQFNRHHQFMLDSGLRECRKVMDLGTGNGVFLATLAKKHPDILFVGVDNQEHMIASTSKIKLNNTKCLAGDANNPKTIIGIEEADGILMRYLLLHMKSIPEVINKLYKSIKKNTRLWVIDLDLEHYECSPPDKAFDLIVGLVRKFSSEYSVDKNVGSKLVSMLKQTGFRSIKREIEPFNTNTIELPLLQQFIIQEVVAYRAFMPSALTDQEFNTIKKFVDELPSSGTFVNYGITLISALK